MSDFEHLSVDMSLTRLACSRRPPVDEPIQHGWLYSLAQPGERRFAPPTTLACGLSTHVPPEFPF